MEKEASYSQTDWCPHLICTTKLVANSRWPALSSSLAEAWLAGRQKTVQAVTFGVHCRSVGVQERVPLSVVLRHTGSSLSSQARVSGSAPASPTTDAEDANLFTPRWPTLRRYLARPQNFCPSCYAKKLIAYIFMLWMMVITFGQCRQNCCCRANLKV